jgi:hypothetical protein
VETPLLSARQKGTVDVKAALPEFARMRGLDISLVVLLTLLASALHTVAREMQASGLAT